MVRRWWLAWHAAREERRALLQDLARAVGRLERTDQQLKARIRALDDLEKRLRKRI